MNKIYLTQRQFNHIQGHVERHGWGSFVQGLPITFISAEIEPRPSNYGFMNPDFGIPVVAEYILKVDGKFTVNQWIDLLGRIESL